MTEQSAWTLLVSSHRLSLAVAFLSAALLLIGAFSSGLVQNPGIFAPTPIKAMPVVPIFAVVNRLDDHVVFVNENDLGYRAKNLFPYPEGHSPHERSIAINNAGMISLRQPDFGTERKTSRNEIDLNISSVAAAMQQGFDHSRVNNYHETRVFELSTGEQAMWIMVPHFRKYLRYSSGLIYVVRDNRPVILYQMSATHEFQLRDFDNNGFLDIGRVVDRSFAWTHWQTHRFDPTTGHFVETDTHWHWFPLRFTVQDIKVLLYLCLPLLMTVTLAAWLRRHWISMTANVIAQLYLLLVVVSIGVISTLNFFPLIWAISVSVLLIALMRLARVLVRNQQVKAPEDQDSSGT